MILPLLLKEMEGGGALAKVQSIDLPSALKDLFPDRLIKELARESGFIVRERKVKAVPFFWNLVLGFGKAATRSISNLRRSYESASGETLVPSAFYDRFDDELVSMLRSATGHALDSFQLAGPEAMEVAKAFKDVIVADASVIKLFDDLKTVFPGCRTNSAPAAAKIHAFLSVKGAGKSTVAITSPSWRAGSSSDCSRRKRRATGSGSGDGGPSSPPTPTPFSMWSCIHVRERAC